MLSHLREFACALERAPVRGHPRALARSVDGNPGERFPVFGSVRLQPDRRFDRIWQPDRRFDRLWRPDLSPSPPAWRVLSANSPLECSATRSRTSANLPARSSGRPFAATRTRWPDSSMEIQAIDSQFSVVSGFSRTVGSIVSGGRTCRRLRQPGGSCPRTAHSSARPHALAPPRICLRARAGARSRPPARAGPIRRWRSRRSIPSFR